MGVTSAFKIATRAAARNPILFVVAGLYGLLQVPQVLAQAVHPLLSSVVSLAMLPVTILVAPFVVAGMIAMAADAIDGTTRFDTLIERGKRHYISVLGAYLLLIAVNLVLVFVLLATVFAGGVVFVRQGSPDPALLAVVGVALVVLVLVYLAVAFFLQFFGHAIVLEDHGATGGLKRSVHLVRDNLLATAGYSLVLAVLGGVIGLVAGILSMLASAGVSSEVGGSLGPGAGFGPGSGMQPGANAPGFLPDVGVAGALVALLLYLVVTGIFGGFFATYSTAFYREMRPDGTLEE